MEALLLRESVAELVHDQREYRLCLSNNFDEFWLDTQ